MDDAISRQDAIRWVKTECNPYGKPTLDYETGKKFIEYLKTMPSAEPEILACGEGELNVPDWNEMIVICDCCGHAIHVKWQEVGNDSETD